MIVLKAPQQKLLDALQSVAGIVERRHTLPILANVLMRKNGSSVEFTTSDLEIQVRTHAELDLTEELAALAGPLGAPLRRVLAGAERATGLQLHRAELGDL